MRPDLPAQYHFLLIAPNLGAEWLFDAARIYWERYRPTVIPDFELIRYIPPDRTIAITVIARRDIAPQLGVELAQIQPLAYFDAVVFDLFEDARRELTRRANQNQPFGVPLATPTPDPAMPSIPTPRLPATRPPAGFVTATPPEAFPPMPTPEPEATDGQMTEAQPFAPVTRTPGPIIGGG
ncbi:MAG: hypothetical protein SNJ59_04820 [Aggregatilineales bacterium]